MKVKMKMKEQAFSLLYESVADLVLSLPASTIGDSLPCAAPLQKAMDERAVANGLIRSRLSLHETAKARLTGIGVAPWANQCS